MTITSKEWNIRYLAPLINVANGLMEPSDELRSGFAGFVLDGILAVKDIDGQDSNDWECVEMVEELIKYAKLADEKENF